MKDRIKDNAPKIILAAVIIGLYVMAAAIGVSWGVRIP